MVLCLHQDQLGLIANPWKTIMNHCLRFVWTVQLWKWLHSHPSNNYLRLRSNLAGQTVPTQAPGGHGGPAHPSQRGGKCDVTVRSGRRSLLHSLNVIRDGRGVELSWSNTSPVTRAHVCVNYACTRDKNINNTFNDVVRLPWCSYAVANLSLWYSGLRFPPITAN